MGNCWGCFHQICLRFSKVRIKNIASKKKFYLGKKIIYWKKVKWSKIIVQVFVAMHRIKMSIFFEECRRSIIVGSWHHKLWKQTKMENHIQKIIRVFPRERQEYAGPRLFSCIWPPFRVLASSKTSLSFLVFHSSTIIHSMNGVYSRVVRGQLSGQQVAHNYRQFEGDFSKFWPFF